MKHSVAVAPFSLFGTFASANLMPVHFEAPTAAHFQGLIRNSTIDFGCRPVAHPTDNGQFKLHALLTEAQIEYLTRDYQSIQSISLHINEELAKRTIAATAPIGTGDRFEYGSVTPVGLGKQSSGSTIDSIMNVEEINSAFEALVNNEGVGSVNLPYTTFKGARQFAGYVGGGADWSKYHLYLSAGVHARERGGPDQLIYWVADLLAANKAGSGLSYGNRKYTNEQVQSILNAGIVFFPLVNPDGVAYDQSSGSLWRKNRNTKSGTTGRSIGVDINRNFDFLWDFQKYFDPATQPASTSPTSETFYGAGPASEPETQNHASVYDLFPNIRWFLDIHSAAGDVLYSWGDDQDQDTNTTMNFLNPQFDGKRGIIDDIAYKEYISSSDATIIQDVAAKTVAAMAAVGGRSYISMQSVGLYATSGASDDYAYSRYWANPGANKVYGFTMEFGYPTNFYPTLTEFNQNILDTNAGFMDWALAAIAYGLE